MSAKPDRVRIGIVGGALCVFLGVLLMTSSTAAFLIAIADCFEAYAAGGITMAALQVFTLCSPVVFYVGFRLYIWVNRQ
jgi:hypothetical protein